HAIPHMYRKVLSNPTLVFPMALDTQSRSTSMGKPAARKFSTDCSHPSGKPAVRPLVVHRSHLALNCRHSSCWRDRSLSICWAATSRACAHRRASLATSSTSGASGLVEDLPELQSSHA